MIIRCENRKTFTVISNQAINDTQISDKALGTLVRLLSKPDNWNLNVNHMVKTGKQGRTAVRSSIAELEKAGYIHRDVVRNEAGRITGTEYLVYEQAVAKVKGGTEMDPPSMKANTGIGPNMDGSSVTERAVVREQNFERVSPGTIPLEDSSNMRQPLIQEAVAEQPHNSQVKTATRDKTQSSETCMRETSPVINTNIEQTLRVTTTTAPDPKPEPKVEVVERSPQSYPATEDINFLLDLISEQHQQPMVISLVNNSVKQYTSLELEEAIVYSSANVKGGAMQYKAYLDKTLKNQWAAGYLDTINTTSPAVLSPGGFTGAIPAGRFPNGTVTGCARMDSNYMAIADFLNRRRARDDK